MAETALGLSCDTSAILDVLSAFDGLSEDSAILPALEAELDTGRAFTVAANSSDGNVTISAVPSEEMLALAARARMERGQ